MVSSDFRPSDGPEPLSDLYETDPHAWAMSQADALRGVARSHPRLGLDFPHLIEELDGMAGSDRRRVENLARQIVQHLLLLEYSPATEPRRVADTSCSRAIACS